MSHLNKRVTLQGSLYV